MCSHVCSIEYFILSKTDTFLESSFKISSPSVCLTCMKGILTYLVTALLILIANTFSRYFSSIKRKIYSRHLRIQNPWDLSSTRLLDTLNYQRQYPVQLHLWRCYWGLDCTSKLYVTLCQTNRSSMKWDVRLIFSITCQVPHSQILWRLLCTDSLMNLYSPGYLVT